MSENNDHMIRITPRSGSELSDAADEALREVTREFVKTVSTPVRSHPGLIGWGIALAVTGSLILGAFTLAGGVALAATLGSGSVPVLTPWANAASEALLSASVGLAAVVVTPTVVFAVVDRYRAQSTAQSGLTVHRVAQDGQFELYVDVPGRKREQFAATLEDTIGATHTIECTDPPAVLTTATRVEAVEATVSEDDPTGRYLPPYASDGPETPDRLFDSMLQEGSSHTPMVVTMSLHHDPVANSELAIVREACVADNPEPLRVLLGYAGKALSFVPLRWGRSHFPAQYDRYQEPMEPDFFQVRTVVWTPVASDLTIMDETVATEPLNVLFGTPRASVTLSSTRYGPADTRRLLQGVTPTESWFRAGYPGLSAEKYPTVSAEKLTTLLVSSDVPSRRSERQSSHVDRTPAPDSATTLADQRSSGWDTDQAPGDDDDD
ncbi:hypothetical protein RYH80_07120 [Halobaculum sp. MBLA0147]|uniref:hypothetical protein n=1 Tax=Halobaculum sp. MBLA0147 TaxID=3079934 RepID=UPI00352644F8